MTQTEREQHLDAILEKGYHFKSSAYISRAFSIFKEKIWLFAGFTLTFFAISIVLGFVPVIGSIASSFFVSPALVIGYGIGAYLLINNQQLEFGNLFDGFKQVFPLALVTLMLSILMLIAMIPAMADAYTSGLFETYIAALSGDLSSIENLENSPSITWGFISIIPLAFVVITLSWALYFVYFFKFSAFKAMEYSFRFLSKKVLPYLLFAILLSLILILGMVLLFVGLLAAIPVAYIAQYIAFADATQLQALHVTEDTNDFVDLV